MVLYMILSPFCVIYSLLDWINKENKIGILTNEDTLATPKEP